MNKDIVCGIVFYKHITSIMSHEIHQGIADDYMMLTDNGLLLAKMYCLII